jgi:hypothetical protein
MIEKRDKERAELEQKALQILENPGLLPKDETTGQFIPTLHLWISPSFTPEIHWVFYKPRLNLNPQPKPRIRQLIWKRQDDLRRLFDPLVGLKEGFHTEPTFEIKTVEIAPEKFKEIHDELARIHFPAFVKDEILGLDGVHFGVQTLGFYHSARVSWWSSYPKEWQELVVWYEEMREFLEGNFNDR